MFFKILQFSKTEHFENKVKAYYEKIKQRRKQKIKRERKIEKVIIIKETRTCKWAVAHRNITWGRWIAPCIRR
jgi:hypothetical protein